MLLFLNVTKTVAEKSAIEALYMNHFSGHSRPVNHLNKFIFVLRTIGKMIFGPMDFFFLTAVSLVLITHQFFKHMF